MNKYELHITVDPSSDINKLSEAAKQVSGKVLDIQLSRGVHPRQLMIGINFTHYEPGFAFQVAARATNALSKHFKIVRSKVEGHPGNDDEPIKPLYLEAHWKVIKDTSLSLVSTWTDIFPVLRSYNNTQPEIEYWTIRSMYPIRPWFFRKAFEGITRNLSFGGNLIKPGHMEVAILDTNLKLDEGWDPDV